MTDGSGAPPPPKRPHVAALVDPGVPAFREDGTLPPYKGSFVKLERSSAALSPYRVEPRELVDLLGGSPRRRQLLRGLFRYRRDLVPLRLRYGLQWIGGSFTELGREPKDLDCVTFALVPDDWFEGGRIREDRAAAHAEVIDPLACRSRYGVDAHFALVNHLVPAMHAAHSWAALYGHTKGDVWKGFFELAWSEDRTADDLALAGLDALDALPDEPSAPGLARGYSGPQAERATAPVPETGVAPCSQAIVAGPLFTRSQSPITP